jgi:hypothetical protein
MTKSKKTDDAKVQSCTLSKRDIAAFTKAAEHRVGRIAYRDWRVISGIFKKASDLAGGWDMRHSPVYKRKLSHILKDLPPIAHSQDTAKKYRASLLAVENAEPDFSAWYDKEQPRVSNPIDLWSAYRATLTRDNDEPAERTINGHEQELARVHQETAAKITAQADEIAELKTGKPSTTTSVEELLRRAWDAEWSTHDFDPQAVDAVHAKLLNLLSEIADEYSVETETANNAVAGDDDAA